MTPRCEREGDVPAPRGVGPAGDAARDDPRHAAHALLTTLGRGGGSHRRPIAIRIPYGTQFEPAIVPMLILLPGQEINMLAAVSALVLSVV